MKLARAKFANTVYIFRADEPTRRRPRNKVMKENKLHKQVIDQISDELLDLIIDNNLKVTIKANGKIAELFIENAKD